MAKKRMPRLTRESRDPKWLTGGLAGRSARGRALPALRVAFPLTVPVLFGFAFLGLTYGAYMASLGFAWYYPAIMALVVFGGSLEFIAAGMLLAPFAPVTTLAVAVAVQARHLFYGIAMLDAYRNAGWMRPYLVFGLCDETFAINRVAHVPKGIETRWLYFWVTALVHLYWIASATVGGVLGQALPEGTEGLSFVMTALFVVIFLDQWKTERVKWPALVGFAASATCLAAFGSDGFMLPTMALTVVALTATRNLYERKLAQFDSEDAAKREAGGK